MLRILLIIAVALAVVIGLQRLTSYRQGAVGPAAPASSELATDAAPSAAEVIPTADSMDVPATDMIDSVLPADLVDNPEPPTAPAGSDVPPEAPSLLDASEAEASAVKQVSEDPPAPEALSEAPEASPEPSPQ